MENNQSQTQKSNVVTNETKGRGLFYGVIAIATFIIMAVGATFAYFTATTSSMNSSVQTGSTTLELDYISYETAWMKRDLIPADTRVAEYSFEKQDDTTITDEASRNNTLCVDDDGNSICSVYVFQVVNTAKSEQIVSIDVVSTENTFKSLHAMAYQISLPSDTADYENVADGEEGVKNPNGDGDPIFKKHAEDNTEGAITVLTGDNKAKYDYDAIYINRKGVQKVLLDYTETMEGASQTKLTPAIERALVQTHTKTGEELEALPNTETVTQKTAKIANGVKIPGSSTATFALVIYILDDDTNQTDSDADKSFTGQVVVGSGDGGGVSGQIGKVESAADLGQDADKYKDAGDNQ